MNENEKLLDEIITMQLQSMRIDAHLRKKVIADLIKLEKSIIAELAASDISGSSITNKRLEGLLSSVRKIIDNNFDGIDSNYEKLLKDFIKLEMKKTGKVMATVTVATTAITAKKINQIYSNTLIEGAPTAEWWARQKTKTKTMFEDTIREGLLRNENNQQLIQRIRGTKEFNYTNGIMNTTRNDAEVLVRSSVQAVANNARFSVFEDNDDLIESYRHVSTLDSRTTTECVVRDGLRWDAKTKKPIGHDIPFQIPPIHWGCRSTIIPELKGVTLPKDTTRASIDGQVSANTTFAKFLKSKPVSFQDEVLGKGKAQLYRSGKITLRQLLDQSGNPLNLAQLKKKYNV